MTHVDLFTWREVSEAAAEAAAADAAWEEAKKKVAVAPHGQIRKRLDRAREAAHAALRAELAERQALKGAPR